MSGIAPSVIPVTQPGVGVVLQTRVGLVLGTGGSAREGARRRPPGGRLGCDEGSLMVSGAFETGGHGREPATLGRGGCEDLFTG